MKENLQQLIETYNLETIKQSPDVALQDARVVFYQQRNNADCAGNALKPYFDQVLEGDRLPHRSEAVFSIYANCVLPKKRAFIVLPNHVELSKLEVDVPHYILTKK
ncbi:MAG: hypothetical protein ACOCQQ_03715 [Candidatus Nanoarchaeia archaeon]